MKKLSEKHAAFVDEYLCCFNATQAYMRVYPKTKYAAARANSARMIAKDNIKDEIQARLTKKHISADEVLALLSDHARGSHRPFVKIKEDGAIYFDFSNPEAVDSLHLIKKIETKRTRRLEGKGDKAEEWEDESVKVELHDSQRALEMLGKYHKLFVEKVDLTSDGEKIQNISIEQSAERIAYLLEVARKRKNASVS